MAFNVFNKVTERGVSAKFKEAIAAAPNVFENHVERVPSEGEDEKYAWLGAVPRPREHIGPRLFQQFAEFNQTIVNKAYETSFLIHRDTFADDRINSIQSRIGEAAESHAHWKDEVFASLLIDGETDTAFDGTAFFDATRTIGSSGTIDNTGTIDATLPNSPTTTNILAALKEIIQQMTRFADDQGRIGFNGTAMSTLRVVIPPEYQKVFAEVLNSTTILDASGTAGVSNVWAPGLVSMDELPWLTDADNAFYTSALAAARKPYYFQDRETLEVVVLNNTNDVAENNGVKVLVRERFRFAYGDPRRAFRFDFT